MSRPVAVVTGASRGIGAEVAQQLAARGFEVLACARNTEAVQDAPDGSPGVIRPTTFDVTSDNDARDLGRLVGEYPQGVRVLVNNAGVALDGWSSSVLDVPLELFRDTWETNVLGALRAVRAVWPAMQVSESRPRIINVSSGMGQLSEMGRGVPAYRTSKTMLNAVTRNLAAELGDQAWTASVCPGWVRTDMGSDRAPKSVAEGADTIVWLATEDPLPGVSGLFWRDRGEIDW
jgi:NAD(P)-dependent dehydrogenase (short-subunit alcohol dehydrogenase family)